MGVWRRSLFVGYAQSGLQNGGTLSAAQFLNIGADEAMPLESIKPTGDDTSDNVSLQTLDAYGYTATSYQWINWAGEGADEEAWVDDEYAIVTGVTFAPGTALWISGNSSEQGVQTAGKVGTSDVLVQLRNGGTATGNPFPVSINLQDIIVSGDDTSDNVALQTLDAYGYTATSYQWINWAGEGADEEAWVDDEYTIVTGVTFAPGQGLWVSGSSDSQYLRFPAPEL